MAGLEYHTDPRGTPGYTVSITTAAGNTYRAVVPAMAWTNSAGTEVGTAGNPLITSAGSAALTAGSNASGTATTSASVLAAANAARTFLVGQNIGANNIWINEIGGTAAANTAGSYKVIPGGAFSVSTNRAVSVIAETGSTAYTATEG
jgi:hypothetical protein